MSELTYYDLKQSAPMTLSLSVQLARELGRRIVAGAYEADAFIEDELAMVKRYQVSRVVVRDAVKILVSKGLLEVRRGLGTRVLPRSQWMLLDDDVLAWHLSASPDKAFLGQLMEIRLAFEPKAARWAAERGTEEDFAAIKAAFTAMDAQQYTEADDRSVNNFIKADALFHRAVLRAAHNELLKVMEGVIYSALLVSIRITNKDPLANGTSIPFHREVYEAIVARDGARAEQLTEKLLKDASYRLEKTDSH